MVSTYEQESGFRPENESDIMIRLRVLAGEIYRQRVYAGFIMRQMFPTTAEGEYLDAHAEQRGLSRKHGTYAAGRVTFTAAAEEHGDILIPAGTELCTVKDGLRFVTDSDATLGSGSQTVQADATAAQAGSAYNVGVGKIGVIVTPVIGIGAVRNADRFRGGTDDESDGMLRERVLDSYRNINNGANAAYYRSIALSVDGVYSASAVGCGRGAGTVDVYACAEGSSLSAAKLSEIQTKLDELREVNVDARVFSPSSVSIDLYIKLTVAEGYDFDDVAAEVRTAVRSYINGLGIGRDFLLCDAGEVIYHTEGVAAYKFRESYGSDRTIGQSRYAVPGTIVVRDE